MHTRGRTALRLAALACAGVATVATLAALRPNDAASASTTMPAARTPLLSPRRVPGLIDDAADAAAHRRADATLDARLRKAIGSNDVCVAADVATTPIARIGAHALAPASTLKVLTAIASITTLGSDYRFSTRAVPSGGGTLTIVGAGDPVLATPEYMAARRGGPLYSNAAYTSLAQLADAIAAAGVRSLPGGLIVDDDAHDSLRFLPQWKQQYATEGDVGALGALAVDGGSPNRVVGAVISDPAIVTGQKLGALLAARGVSVGPAVRHGVAPAGAREIAHVDSPPLRTIVANMLTVSNDFTAEELVRDIAAHADPQQAATTQQGLQVMERALRSVGIPDAGVTLYDGSGLARADRVPCTVLLRAIEVSALPRYAAVAAGLPVGGRTGTLAHRFADAPFNGEVHAKTGTLEGVAGLTGQIDIGAHARFAVLANGSFWESQGQNIVDGVARAIGEYPVVRAPAGLVPDP